MLPQFVMSFHRVSASLLETGMSKMKIECLPHQINVTFVMTKLNSMTAKLDDPYLFFLLPKTVTQKLLALCSRLKPWHTKNKIDALVHKSMRQVVFHLGHTTSDVHLRSFDKWCSSVVTQQVMFLLRHSANGIPLWSLDKYCSYQVTRQWCPSQVTWQVVFISGDSTIGVHIRSFKKQCPSQVLWQVVYISTHSASDAHLRSLGKWLVFI